MAIVFVSPKQRQKMFFLGITILFLLILSVIGTIVFFSKPEPIPVEQAFIKPKIKIDFEVLDLEQVKGSLLMGRVQKEGIEIGRENPFTPYYTLSIPTINTKTK